MVSLPVNGKQLRKNILCFNQYFKIYESEQEDVLKLEINDLMKLNIDWMREIAEDSALRLWDLIEATYNQSNSQKKKVSKRFPLLSKIFQTAHAIATSSATIEQTFSLMKLLKNDLRNKLSEKTLESLLLFCQEYNDKKVIASDRLIELFDGTAPKEELDERTRDNVKRSANDEKKLDELSQKKRLKPNENAEENKIEEPIKISLTKKNEDEHSSQDSVYSLPEMDSRFEDIMNHLEIGKADFYELDEAKSEESDDNLFK